MQKIFLLIPLLLAFGCQAQNENEHLIKHEKMKIEIWSDIVCPWCYIGKRRFEAALNNFEYKDYVEVEYKSYQLDPQMETDTSVNIHQYLSDKKGISLEQAQQMSEQVSGVAASVGLDYNLDKSIPVNTLQAHGLLHYAKAEGKQVALKERLMKAYFIETLNLDDTDVLVKMAEEVGLDGVASRKVMETNQFKKEVQQDIQEGVQLGLRGVPFFVFNRKYGISGAQEEAAFTETLEGAFTDWRKDNPIEKLEIIDGKVCTPEGKCE